MFSLHLSFHHMAVKLQLTLVSISPCFSFLFCPIHLVNSFHYGLTVPQQFNLSCQSSNDSRFVHVQFVSQSFRLGTVAPEVLTEGLPEYRGADKALAWPTYLSVVFSVQGTGGSPTGLDPENRVGNQDFGSPGRPVSSGLLVPDEWFSSWSG
jgi:hypothetical protein